MTPFAAKLASNKPCFYHDIFFATWMRVSHRDEKSVTLSVLSPNEERQQAVALHKSLQSKMCWELQGECL